MGKRGVKSKFVYDEKIAKDIQALAAYGLTHDLIAWYYGYSSLDGWGKIRKKYPEISKQFKIGKVKAIAKIGQRLYEKALAGHPACMMFYLKTQGGWSEKIRIEDESKPAKQEHKLVISCIDPVDASREYQKIMKGE